MNELENATAAPMPARIAALPRCPERQLPVPWFVAWLDGVPEFRCADSRKFKLAIEENRCWTCGEVLGAHKVFAIGPMCAVNRVTAEPPNHLDCAEYSARACPFLSNPKRRRRENDMPEERLVAGEMIRRNPGVTLLWSTKKFRPFRHGNGVLFRLSDPTQLSWWCRGRTATTEEIVDSIESGMPILRDIAAADGGNASAELELMYLAAQRLIPRAPQEGEAR